MPDIDLSGTLMNWILAAVIMAVCLIIMFIVCGIVKRTMLKSGADGLLVQFVIVVLRVLFITVGLIAALEKVGVNPSSFITVLGVAGAAIALSIKDSLANVAGGILIIVTHKFKKDDFIEVAGVSGLVQKTDLLMTTLRTYDNREISIPNSLLSSSVITNYEAQDIRRITVTVMVDVNEDLKKAKEVLQEEALKSALILEQPAPAAHVDHTQGGAASIDLFVWCRTDEYWDAYYYMNENASKALREAGIKTHGPVKQVHVTEE